jgi:hypothetical protein
MIFIVRLCIELAHVLPLRPPQLAASLRFYNHNRPTV